MAACVWMDWQWILRMTSRRTSTKPRKSKRTRRPIPWQGWLLRNVLLLSIVSAALYIGYLDLRIRSEFEGTRWAVPARVYARALELYPGRPLSREQLLQELQLLGYTETTGALRSGAYHERRGELVIATRAFQFWDGAEPERTVRVEFTDGGIAALRDAETGSDSVALVRLDPYEIATILPAHQEDRILVQRAGLPSVLVDMLLAVEDRRFYSHHGVDVRGLARAAWANLRAGGIVQGGSTLTQQLVKNFFLTQERTWTRKLNEIVMSVLVDWHYSKDDILTAYCNEVFLAQDGRRAIHGFGLAAQHYFGRDLNQLSMADMALLVGLVKGPSYYDPRRHPERALARRNQVLGITAAAGVIPEGEAERARRSGLGVTLRSAAVSRFPAYLDLVRRQLRRDYRDEDLRSTGLRVFTALDPLTQFAAEEAVSRGLKMLPGETARRGALQAAAVVTHPGSGEVLAVVGDRDPFRAGFNRALLAERQIGSLIKPAVYLTALEQGYTLLSAVEDEAVSVVNEQGETWAPRNFDGRFHGTVPLYYALAHSYNAASVRLGLTVGVENVLDVVHRLGISRRLPPYPSTFLGAASLTPLEVTQMYQTLAGGGFVTPLRTIRAVVSAEGEPLQRYGVDVRQTIAPEPVYLLNTALQEVVRQGTGQGLTARIGTELAVAGKTGTTNDARDSWFAGFSGDRLAVVWIGRDDNGPAGLTGSSGALPIFAEILRRSSTQPLLLGLPEMVEWVWIDREGRRASERCRDAIQLAFVRGSAPAEDSTCGSVLEVPLERATDWFKGLFE